MIHWNYLSKMASKNVFPSYQSFHVVHTACMISDISADFFILFVDPYHKQIYQMQTNSREFRTQGVPVSRMEFPVSIDFDLAGRRVYWIDRETKQIKSSRLDGSQDQVFHQVPQGILITACL